MNSEGQQKSPLYDEPPGGFKRRRLQNACDLCRQKKIRCDSAQKPGNICSNCIAFNAECTHLLGIRRKGNAAQHPDEGESSTDFARSQINAILSSSTPYTLPTDPLTLLKTLTEIAAYARSLEKDLSIARRSNSPPSSTSDPAHAHVSASSSTSPRPVYSSAAFDESKGQDYFDLEISDPLARLDLHGGKHTFFGKSSQMALLKTAIDTRNEFEEQEKEKEKGASKRPAYWIIYPWQTFDPPALPPLEFPEPDLMSSLVDLYFTRYNVFMPLLHRPTFERNLKQDLHQRDRYFGELVLSVCAIGARYSEDHRVYYRGSTSEHGVGWEYFRQIHPLRPSLAAQPSVYEVQLICTSSMFLQPTSTPEYCWPLTGLGIRYAQSIGVHRRGFNSKGKKPTVESELWKRAFWVLVAIDAYMSAFLGRPRCANQADYDLELPIICDDEYWEHPDPDKAFRQPAGKPSTTEAWVAHLKLLSILGFAQHHMFAVKRVEQWANISDDEWDEKVAIELDSALNRWIDEVPDHLRWNPHGENQLFFEQSSGLYCSYYWVQIQIHRPFIGGAGATSNTNRNRSTKMSYSSLAVCANAARSCSHVLDVTRRKGYVPFPSTFISLFTSAIVLLLNLWRGRRVGLSMDPVREIGDVYRCVNTLHVYENRWQVTGRLSDIIMELISISDTPLEAYTDSSKRGRDDGYDSSYSSDGTTTTSTALAHTTATAIAAASASVLQGNFQGRGTTPASDSGPSSVFSPQTPQSLQNAQFMSMGVLGLGSGSETPLRSLSSGSSSSTTSTTSTTPSPALASSSLSMTTAVTPTAMIMAGTGTTTITERTSLEAGRLFGLPLHTEDLGRLPIHHFMEDAGAGVGVGVNANVDGNAVSQQMFDPPSTLFRSATEMVTAAEYPVGLEGDVVVSMYRQVQGQGQGPEYGAGVGVGSEMYAGGGGGVGGVGGVGRVRSEFGYGIQQQQGQGQGQGYGPGAPVHVPSGPQPQPQVEVKMLDRDEYVLGMWATPSGDRWEDWDSYMSAVDDLLRAMDPAGAGTAGTMDTSLVLG